MEPKTHFFSARMSLFERLTTSQIEAIDPKNPTTWPSSLKLWVSHVHKIIESPPYYVRAEWVPILIGIIVENERELREKSRESLRAYAHKEAEGIVYRIDKAIHRSLIKK